MMPLKSCTPRYVALGCCLMAMQELVALDELAVDYEETGGHPPLTVLVVLRCELRRGS